MVSPTYHHDSYPTAAPERILVVDDEQDLCEILHFNLDAEGYAVDCANSAEQALSMIDAGEHYDLLLLDVMLERMSGFDLAVLLRARGDSTPVIFLTARDQHADQMQGFLSGADDYITKPFAFDTVLARVRAVLRRSHGIMPGEVPQLTHREYLIWQFFNAHPGRFFSRQEIMQAVWPDQTLVSERSVDVHIARLRKKLGSHGNRIINKTGFGYGMV
ncbi:MAG: response regulator transcription factor [Bacteroidales bacterium]|nr:response regulator transcription factor [Bacteroidales bacterium]MBR1850662.1 response regulator transcription factor [Bacteroidales bacterium]